MRGGLVAGGIALVFVGFSWWYVLGALARLAPGASVGIMDAVWLVCVLPIVFIIIGFMVFVAGLAGKSQAELDAMRPQYFPMTQAPPQIVYVEAPPRAPPTPPVGRLQHPPPPRD